MSKIVHGVKKENEKVKDHEINLIFCIYLQYYYILYQRSLLFTRPWNKSN